MRTHPFTLNESIATFASELPGWWWTVGMRNGSTVASCGPEIDGPDAYLLKEKAFDHEDWLFEDGFHVELDQQITLGDALMTVFGKALEAIAFFKITGWQNEEKNKDK